MMIIRSLAVAAASLLLATGAMAQSATTPSANPEDCLKSAFELAQKAEEQKLSTEQLDRIEEMLSRMEQHCDNKQFSEAAAVAKDLSTLIETKRQ